MSFLDPYLEMLLGFGPAPRGATSVTIPTSSQQTEPVVLNTNVLLRQPFAAAMDDMDDHYMLYVYQPNMRKQDVSLSVCGSLLCVHGCRQVRDVSCDFSRELLLPSDADTSQLQAEFHSGRMEIKIPKVSSRRAYRNIPIHGIESMESKQAEQTEEQLSKKQAPSPSPEPAPAPAPAPVPSPRRNIPISGIETETEADNEKGVATGTKTPETKEQATTKAEATKKQAPRIPQQQAEATATAPSKSSGSGSGSIPVIGGMTRTQAPAGSGSESGFIPIISGMSKQPTESKQQEQTGTHPSAQAEDPAPATSKATRECEPFPCVDVGGIPEEATEAEAKSTGESTSTIPVGGAGAGSGSPLLESDVSLSGHDVATAKQRLEEEKQSHELEKDIQQHKTHHHHHEQQQQQQQPTIVEKQMEMKTTSPEIESETERPSVISRVTGTAKQVANVVLGTGSASGSGTKETSHKQ